MRSTTVNPRYGTHRTITKFLWLPLTIVQRHENGTITIERRWLEKTKIEQRWTKGRLGDFWCNVRFLP